MDFSDVQQLFKQIGFKLMRLPLRCVLESCAGRVNPRGLRVPAFAGRVRGPALLCVRVRGPALLCVRVRVRVELAVGRGGLNLVRVRVEKLFVRVTEC